MKGWIFAWMSDSHCPWISEKPQKESAASLGSINEARQT
jgi:hypothetical protein